MAIDCNPNTALLTPPVRYVTSVKATEVKVELEDEQPVFKLVESATDTVAVDVCSELTTIRTPTRIMEGSHKLSLVWGSKGQSVVFSIGSDHRLYCSWHVNGASTAWKYRDITPINASANAFDVLEVLKPSGHVRLAVAVVPGGDLKKGDSDVYTCADLDIVRFLAESTATVPWVKAANNEGAHHVQTMVIAPPKPGKEDDPAFVLVGTLQQNDVKMASNYTVSLDPKNTAPWAQLALPTDRTLVVDLAPAQLSGVISAGVFTLYGIFEADHKFKDGLEYGTIVRFNSFHDSKINFAPELTSIGGTARSITTSVNAAGYSDLFVAGSTGVGYWQSSDVHNAKPTATLLPGVNIHQIAAYESGRKITVLATSTSGDLYVAEGARDPYGKPLAYPKWTWSGLAIRTGVRHMAVRAAKTDGLHIMYISDDAQLNHLVRDPQTGLWNSHKISIRAAPDTQSAPTPAFVTQLSFLTSSEEPLPADYELNLTATELVYVTINDRTHEVGTQPTKIRTDTNGQIRIVLEADESLAAPSYTLHLRSSAASEDIIVDPTQRVMRKMLATKSVDQLQNARSTSGKAVFAKGAIREDAKDGLNAALKTFPSALKTADGNLEKRLGAGVSLETEKAAGGGMKSEDGRLTATDEEAEEDKGIFDYIGDALECVARGIAKVFAVVLKVLDEGLLFVLTIAKKVFKFVCKTIGPVVRLFANILRDTLGLDLTGILDWLAVVFDGENIAKTHKVLTDFATNGIDLISKAIVGNVPFVAHMFEVIRGLIDIPDDRLPEDKMKKPEKGTGIIAKLKQFFGGIVDAIFNNPIVHGILNVLKRIMRAIMEELSDTFTIPSLEPIYKIVSEGLTELFEDEVEHFEGLLRDIISKASKMLRGELSIGAGLKSILGDAFWTLFDSIETAATVTITMLGKLLKAFLDLLNGKWKIPLVSTLWTFLTDCDLTVMNVLTYPVAFTLNLISATINNNKLPFDVWPNPSSYLPKAEDLIVRVPDGVSAYQGSAFFAQPSAGPAFDGAGAYANSAPAAKSWSKKVQSPLAAQGAAFGGASAFADSAAPANSWPHGMQGAAFGGAPNLASFSGLQANDSKSPGHGGSGHGGHEEHDITFLRFHRLWDTIGGSVSAFMALVVSALELTAIKQQGDEVGLGEKAAKQNVAGHWEGVYQKWLPNAQPGESWDEVLGQMEWITGQQQGQQKVLDNFKDFQAEKLHHKTHKTEHVLTVVKVVARVITLIVHAGSMVCTMKASPTWPPNFMWGLSGLKLAGVGLNVLSLWLTWKAPKLGRLADSAMIGGNILGFQLVGVIEFAISKKKKYDWVRFGNDAAELGANVSSLIATFTNAPEATPVNPALYAVGADVLFTGGAMGTMIYLALAYTDKDEKKAREAIEETH